MQISPPLGPITPQPVEGLLRQLNRFAHSAASGGLVLILASVVALIWANSSNAEGYHHLWETYLRLGVGDGEFRMTLHHFINDALMAVFFLLVGLEIKREVLVGQLASIRAATLPIAAAAGGMIVPALLYTAFNAGGPGAAGWGVPMATDIAFALGILALLGPRVPVGLKIFLAALAIADDLGAVLVIALFYTEGVRVAGLVAAGVILLFLIGINRLGFRHPALYWLLGLALWAAVLSSGVHATVAGVLLAMTIPARTRIDTAEFLDEGRRTLREFDAAGVEGESVLTNEGQQRAIMELEAASEAAQSPLRRMERSLHLWVAFLIVPVFALANAGVEIGANFWSAFSNPVTLGVVVGLVVGKPLGILAMSWAAVKSGLAVLPKGVSWRSIVGVSFLGGIGFTMSLFIGTLGFGEGSPLLDSAKIGILSASLVAAVIGALILATDPRTKIR